jgi:hypothetical protein
MRSVSAQETSSRNDNPTYVDFPDAVLGVAILRHTDDTNVDFYGVKLASIMEFANVPKTRNAVYPSYKKDLR